MRREPDFRSRGFNAALASQPAAHTLDATTVKPAPKAKKKQIAEEPEKKANIAKIAGVGAAVGIGSAAIVAALLYTNRRKGAAKD